MSECIKLFQTTAQRVDHETNNYLEPYVSLTLHDTTYSATLGGRGEGIKEVIPNTDGTYTVVTYGHGSTIIVSSTNCLVAILFDLGEVIELSSDGVVDGQDTTFTINGTTYNGTWNSDEYASGWQLHTITNTENSANTNSDELIIRESVPGSDVGSVMRLIITEHDNGQLLHYNKAKLATLTLTDGSTVEIKRYFDDTHTLFEDIIDPYRETLTDVVIHKGVKTIDNNAFHNCTNLTNIFISSSVERIGREAFSYCTSLKTVTFEDPTKLRYLGEPSHDSTFMDCHSLETINLTADTPITYMPTRGFMRNYKLKSIIIPDTVVDISDMALDGCSSLTEITIPAGVKTIDMGAFDGCSALTKVTCLPITPPIFDNTQQFDNTNNCPIYVPAESVSAYKAASGWSRYASRIQAIPTT